MGTELLFGVLRRFGNRLWWWLWKYLMPLQFTPKTQLQWYNLGTFLNIKRNGEDRGESGESGWLRTACAPQWELMRLYRSEAHCFSPNSHTAQSYSGALGTQPRQRKGKVKWRVSAFGLKEGQMVNKMKDGQGPSHRRRKKAEGREHSCPSQAPGKSVWLTSANFRVTHSLIFAAFSWTIFASSALICFYKKERTFS